MVATPGHPRLASGGHQVNATRHLQRLKQDPAPFPIPAPRILWQTYRAASQIVVHVPSHDIIFIHDCWLKKRCWLRKRWCGGTGTGSGASQAELEQSGGGGRWGCSRLPVVHFHRELVGSSGARLRLSLLVLRKLLLCPWIEQLLLVQLLGGAAVPRAPDMRWCTVYTLPPPCAAARNSKVGGHGGKGFVNRARGFISVETAERGA